MMSLLLMSVMLGLGVSTDVMSLMFVSLCLVSVYKHDMDWFLCYGSLMSDGLSVLLILLSIWISVFMILSMMYDNNIKHKLSLKSGIVVLLLFLMVAFSMSNLMGFYIFFEACLLPTLFLIMGWGYQPERVGAGMYMMMYTVVASLPLLCGLMYLDKGGVCFMLSSAFQVKGILGWSMFVICMVAFLVKLPVYMLHLWLPKAHVEAPVGGSMILAGLLLKLGGYGMIRLMKVLGSMSKLSLMFMLSWSMFGGMVVSVLCMRQIDVKCLIALSSVVHMAVIVGGSMVQSLWGYNSVVLVMIGHGLCSSGLFCGANMIYKCVGSRSMSVVKGVQTYMPFMSFMWFLLCSSNMSAPPSLSLLGEVSGGVALVSWSGMFMTVLFMMVFMSGAYSLYLYLGVSHGKGSSVMMSSKVKMSDSLLLIMHWLPLNLIFVVDLC